MQSSDESFQFYLGESFSTYRDHQAKVKNYERLAAVQVTHWNSQTLEGMKSHALNRDKQILGLYITVSICHMFLVDIRSTRYSTSYIRKYITAFINIFSVYYIAVQI